MYIFASEQSLRIFLIKSKTTKMKTLKTSILILKLLIGSILIFNSCKKVTTTPDAPKVTAPTTAIDLQVGTTADVTFQTNVLGGFLAATTTAINGGESCNRKKYFQLGNINIY